MSSDVIFKGTFTTSGHERHFWLSAKGSFLGSMMQFYIEDASGIYFLSSQRAAECGYTAVLNQHGDLVFCAFCLASYAENRGDTEVRVSIQFANNSYPFMLHCSLVGPWSLREIVCEDNYMEIPVVSHEGVKWLDLKSKTLKERAKLLRTGQVFFYRPNDFDNTPRLIQDTKAIGCHRIAIANSSVQCLLFTSVLYY